MKTAQDFLDGQLLLIDKPLHWSSFQAVNKLKYALKRFSPALSKIKIGHAGTLDPLASGLLLVCTGKSTKTIPELQGMVKEYTGTFFLGATTPSYDLETDIDATFSIAHIDQALLEATSKRFIGNIMQQPPVFSAIKKDGKRLYEHARKGETVTIASREVTIYAFELTRIALPEVSFRVVCSKGTYIRSLAHDFGKALSCGGYLAALRRTKIGAYDVAEAISPEGFVEALKTE